MKYKTVVIDPPWKLNKFNSKISKKYTRCSAELPYETMTDEEILNFPINDFADDQCDLFLWVTKSKIHFGFHLLEKWGFHYANFFVWNKVLGLCHNGVHSITEYVIYAYRGKNGLNYKKPIDSYFKEKRSHHSQKPNKFYTMIRNVTTEPRIDIFARKRHYGFDAWGNQVESQMQVPLEMIVEAKER